MINNNCQEYILVWNLYFLVCNKPFKFLFRGLTHNVPSNLNFSSNSVIMMSLILPPFALTKWLTKIFVDCNRFNDVRRWQFLTMKAAETCVYLLTTRKTYFLKKYLGNRPSKNHIL